MAAKRESKPDNPGKKKAMASRESWFAIVNGEMLPCVYKFWWKRGVEYNDEDIRPGRDADELYAAKKERKRVVLTDGIPIYGDNRNVIDFNRTEYIAVFAVEDVAFDSHGLRFKFKQRLTSLA